MNLGDQLRSARLAKNLSVEQLSALSRVSVRNILSFEDNNFSVDARVFVQANLNAISKVLDIDLAEVLPHYEQEHVGQTVNILDLDGTPLKRRNYTPAVMALGLIVLFGVIVYGLFTRAPQIAEPLPEVSFSTSPSATSDSNVAGGVTVLLSAESRSWVSVKNSSNQIIFERILESGEQLTFTDTISLTVTVGNAAGINLTVNDENIGYLGGIGQVVSETFLSPSNPE